MEERLRERIGRIVRTHVARYAIVSLDPPVFYVQLELNATDDFIATYQVLFSFLRGRKAYCLCCYSWNLTPQVLDRVTELERQCRLQFPDIQMIHLCNEAGQPALFHARGAQAVFCNQNCFVDDALFRPIPSIAKRFDAVYDSRFATWKRHLLAVELASIALLYYPLQDDPDYVQALRRDFSHAHFFNHPDSGPYQRLSPRAVNRCLNACRVGLCLSAEEGAMYASVQYLLSGLPIVTTPSQGGRDVFFEDRFVLTVPPQPSAVRQGVAELIERNLDPDDIRGATLTKVRAHRQTFVALVQDIYLRHGVARTFANEWNRVFRDKMTETRSHLDTIAEIQAADSASGD